MAKRNRRPDRARRRRTQPRSNPRSQPQPKPELPENGQAVRTGAAHRENEAKQPIAEWVQIEHRDADGNPTLPNDLIAGTFGRRYQEVPAETDIRVLVLTGYEPKALMMVERKIYEIHRLAVRGWRRRGQIAVEVDGWRGHEADWFNAMRGVPLEIHDPGLPGPQNDKSQYTVPASSFERKIVTVASEHGGRAEIPMYEGTLDITETWRSACRRQASSLADMGFKYLVVPVVSAILGVLIGWWLDRPPSSGSHGSAIPEDHAEDRVPDSTAERAGESSDRTTMDSPGESSASESEQERGQSLGAGAVNARPDDDRLEETE